MKRPYTSANREKIVFGIDYGSTLAKVSVYDRKTARPSLLLNREDGNVPYWHTAVAYDKISKKLVTGKKAKELVRHILLSLLSERFRSLVLSLRALFPLENYRTNDFNWHGLLYFLINFDWNAGERR